MNYIVLDLEWNQCPYGKERANALLPFEIIEIGAVKLNEDLQIIGKYHEIITPKVYPKLHWRTKSVITLTDNDLKGHRSFAQAVHSFLYWCGKVYGQDYMICTYGPADLPELQRNLSFFQIPSPFPFPLFYLDIQKIFGLATEGHKSARSLEYAVDHYALPRKGKFHDAFSDAMYTARVMQLLPADMLRTYYSVDYYKVPLSRKDELHLTYPTYSKYVSRTFRDREQAMHDRGAATCTCSICGRRCRKKILWFPSGSHNYLALAQCPEHGLFQGKLRVKNRPDGSVFVIRTQRPVTDEEAASLRSRQVSYSKKKQEHARLAKLKAASPRR